MTGGIKGKWLVLVVIACTEIISSPIVIDISLLTNELPANFGVQEQLRELACDNILTPRAILVRLSLSVHEKQYIHINWLGNVVVVVAVVVR